jgi:colanic acid/amylovoran biosynthesis glycosyltransferase
VNIAFLLYHWPVLSETFILNQITGLLDRGHEVDTFAKSPGQDPIMHDDVSRYRLLERTLYYGSFSERLPANRLTRVTRAIKLLVQHLPGKPLPLLRALNVFRFGRMALSLGIFYTVIPFLDADKYDIVHCHFGSNGNLAALLRQVGAIKGKIVTTFHGEAQYTKAQERWHRFEPVFQWGDLMLPVSEREKEALIELGCSPQKIVVHRMGVDLERFKFVPRRPRSDSQVHLLTVARLVEKKGLEYAIRATAKVLHKQPRIEYTIVGDGPLRPTLADLIATLGVEGQVKLVGWKRQDEVAGLLRGADILVAPSVTGSDGDQEGIPVALMEALAQGLPVLSTYHAGIPELVQDGQSGFLVPERDVDALAARLEDLVSQPEVWPVMGMAGRDHIARYYDVNKLNDQLVDLYQGLMDGRLA